MPGGASSPSRLSTTIGTNPIRELLERFQQRWGCLAVPQFTELTGLLVIAVGTLLMALPVFSSESVSLWEALFRVISAITVTGLSVVDVGQELTSPGQVLLAGLLFTEHFTRSSGLMPLPWWQELQVVFFQSVGTRTAGFNTVHISVEGISEAGLLLMMTLMFIGASPGGSGDGSPPTLNRWGQLVLMVGMVVGRIGILLLLSAIFGSHTTSRVSYKHEELDL